VFREKDLDKRDKIINAAIEEFGKNSFEKASTNNIVKAAGVSKGLLYHYFKSKQELYDYLIEYIYTTIGNGIRGIFDDLDGDFFKRIQQVALFKIELTKDYPGIYDFGLRLLKRFTYEDLYEILKKYNLDILQRVYTEGIDYSLFKEGVDVAKAMQIIQWTIEKYGESYEHKDSINVDTIMDEMNSYLEPLRLAFYKEEVIND
jgi:AcrR family transcriptional regulator